MKKDFIYIFQVLSRGSWRDMDSGKDYKSLSELAYQWCRITTQKCRVIRLTIETVLHYGDDE